MMPEEKEKKEEIKALSGEYACLVVALVVTFALCHFLFGKKRGGGQ